MQVFAKAVYGQIFGQVIQDVSVDVLFKLLLFDGNQFFCTGWKKYMLP